MVRDAKKLLPIVQRFLDEGIHDACLTIEISGAPGTGFAQVLFDKPRREVRCPKCNIPQYSDALFCHRCGTRLSISPESIKPQRLLFNFGYPYSIEPLQLLENKGIHLPPGSETADWEKAVRATVLFPLTTAQQVVELVDHILSDVQGVKPDAKISASIGYGY